MYGPQIKLHRIVLIGLLLMGSWANAQDTKYLNEPLPDDWNYNEQLTAATPDDAQWWATLGDPTLSSLITQGIANNYDLRMAASRMKIADNTLRAARGQYLPTVDASAGWTKTQTSGLLYGNTGKADRISYFDLGLSAQWEIDLFGKITAQVKAKKAAVKVSKAEYDAAMVSLSAQIATLYIQLRMYQQELIVAENHIKSQERVTQITKARHEAGLASGLDVDQSLVVLNSTQASIPQLRNAINTTIASIAVLEGVYPDSLYSHLSTPQALPDYSQVVATGVPLDLLRRRPDVIEAENQLAVYAAEVGIAKREFLPTLAIEGAIGTSAHSLKKLFNKQSFTYTVAPTLTWTVFDGFQRTYALANAREEMQIGIDDYNLTVLSAVQEVDNAMGTYMAALERIGLINEVVKDAQNAFTKAIDLYKSGLSPFSDVMTSQMNLLEYENEQVVAQGSALTALIDLYRALGGGY